MRLPLRLPTAVMPIAVAATLALALVSGCAAEPEAVPVQSTPARVANDTESAAPASATTSTAPALPQQLPNLGPAMAAQVPADSSQVLETIGAGPNSPNATVVLYQHTTAGWQAGSSWPAHDALDGWTSNKHQGDLRTPIGVFTLTDAGGLLANPGTKLPYYQSSEFTISGRGFEGEPLAGAFDYVIAINYNRKTGVSPLDDTYPLGYEKGTGVWLHVDHGGPTHGCVSIPRADIITLLRTLDPAKHPVIVMGDAAALAR
jgi:L,D-peptidoglycan transpeptidase YkuD (ErfK/YbiS/YcfS/YnhG family)